MTDDYEREPREFADAEDAPLYSRRRRTIARVVVLVALGALVLPGAITIVSTSSRSADYACGLLADYYEVRVAHVDFEVFGPGGFGWECYGGDGFGGERHLGSLGPIPGVQTVPEPRRNA